MTNKIAIDRTEKTKTPAIWESGGAYSNTGGAIIVTLPDGSKPKAVYTVRRGPRACGDHALIPVRVGMYVIRVETWRKKETVRVMRIVRIHDHDNWADVEDVEGIPPFLEAAVEAARAKAREYHCRTPYWVQASDR